MICDWWISFHFVCLCVSRFIACGRNYDWRQRKTQLWRRLLNFRVRMFVKSAVTTSLQLSLANKTILVFGVDFEFHAFQDIFFCLEDIFVYFTDIILKIQSVSCFYTLEPFLRHNKAPNWFEDWIGETLYKSCCWQWFSFQ